MLSIDDLKKLAEMQEKLLKISVNDRATNIEKYKSIAKQIDEYYFSNLLFEIRQVNEHNQTLEEELQFLEQIIASYEQVVEQQAGFKNVCELYGDNGLVLSDLSQIDKEYIDNRMSSINGYLINERNIEDCEKKLDELSGQLRKEEKSNNLLCKRLLEFEEVLRVNFINAEGRYLNDGELEYVSVVSEYKELGYNFKELLRDFEQLSRLLSDVYVELRDADDKLKTAEMCYNRIPSVESKNILDEIKIENLKVKYRLTMLKILELLFKDCDNYDLFIKKRRDLLDLIKYRLSYIKKLGIDVSVDPFSMTKVVDQIKVVESIEDNSKNINRIRKEITIINGRLEEMISDKNNYKNEINTVREIVVIHTDNEVINDSNEDVMDDIHEIDSKIEKDYFEEKTILDNQVVSVRDVSKGFNMGIVNQKTNHVIRKVNDMVNNIVINDDKKIENVNPELVIEQAPVVNSEITINDNNEFKDRDDILVKSDKEYKDIFDLKEMSEDLPLFESSIDESKDNDTDMVEITEVNVTGDKKKEDVSLEIKETPVVVLDTSYDSDIFTTVDPFLEAPLFTNKVEDDFEDIFGDSPVVEDTKPKEEIIEETLVSEIDNTLDSDSFEEDILSIDQIEENSNEGLPELEDKEELEDEMPDAFWTVQEEDGLETGVNDESDDVVLSFDEQVALLRDDENIEDNSLSKSKSRVLKLESNNEIDRKVA